MPFPTPVLRTRNSKPLFKRRTAPNHAYRVPFGFLYFIFLGEQHTHVGIDATNDTEPENVKDSYQHVIKGTSSVRRIGIDIVNSFVPSRFEPYLFLRNAHVQTILGGFLRRNRSCAYIPIMAQSNEPQNFIRELYEKISIVSINTFSFIPGRFESSPSLYIARLIVFLKYHYYALELLPFVFHSIIMGFLEYTQPSNIQGRGRLKSFWDERERIDTYDGDFFHVDYKWNTAVGVGELKQPQNMVILLHGLESSSNSPLSLDMAEAFGHQGFDVAFVNFRGCSGVPNDKLGGYHAGFTDDLLLFMSIIRKRWGRQISIYLSGFSLGANVVIKCLGDLGMDAVSQFNIRGAAVTGCPFDLNIQYRRLVDDPFNRMVYTRTLLRSLKEKANYNLREHCNSDENTNLFDYNKCRNAQTVVDIEEALIVPVFGFQDKFDYYNKTASIAVMDNIVVPTLIVNSADDPFFDSNYFPLYIDCNHGGRAPIKLVRTEYGGHLGYIFQLWPITNETDIPSASFISTELARFSRHVRDYKI